MRNRLGLLNRSRSSGVTLIELAITIALVGILAALIVQFVAPVRSYIDSSRRAALADTADTALRRIGRDVRLALPNSVRVKTVSGVIYLEFLLVRTAGRYRLESDAATTTGCPGGVGIDPALDVLSFSAADDCFKTIGNLYSPASDISKVVAGDFVVVFNLSPGTLNADAYESAAITGGNKSKVVSADNAGAGEDRIVIESHSFSFESPGRRFFIIEGPVTYACAPSPSGGTLTRHSGYAIEAAQPPPPALPAGALLASGVTACTITYDTNVAAQGAGLLTLALRLSMQDSRGDTENVNLYHTVHVNNVP
jgi:MSHA biogenesis protein MshO